MSFATMSAAVAEMESLFRTKWAPRLCDYPNQDFKLPSLETVWARWRCQHFDGGQGSLANVVGKRRWRRQGTLFIQVFTPLNASELLAYDAAEIAVTAYEGTPSGAWFRNVRTNEINPAEVKSWIQRNVMIDFEYDQIH